MCTEFYDELFSIFSFFFYFFVSLFFLSLLKATPQKIIYCVDAIFTFDLEKLLHSCTPMSHKTHIIIAKTIMACYVKNVLQTRNQQNV